MLVIGSYFLYDAVAEGTAGEWAAFSAKIEPVEDFRNLLVRASLMDADSSGEVVSHEESPVASQENAAFSIGDIDQLRAGSGGVKPRIQTQEPQPPGELSEVHVAHEFGLAQGLGPESRHVLYVQRLEDRIHADSVAVGYDVTEVHGATVYENEVDFRVRHAERFDQVLDAPLAITGVLDVCLAHLPREEVVEFFVEPDQDLAHAYPLSYAEEVAPYYAVSIRQVATVCCQAEQLGAVATEHP